MPIFRRRKFTLFPFLILFKRIESIDMTPCVISFLVYSGRMRTLVAMATYSSHRLIMGKVEICIFFSVSMEIFGYFLQKCLLSSPLCFI